MSEVNNDETNDSLNTEPVTDSDDASASGESSQGGGDASLWESRFKGLNAKFGKTAEELKAEKEARAKAEADLEALRTGKVSAEEAAQAQVNAAKAELEAERQARAVERLKAQFPETFEVFGDAAASFDAATLAASEARLAGDSPEGTTPLKHNESRSTTKGKAPAEKTAADVEAELLSMPVPWAT